MLPRGDWATAKRTPWIHGAGGEVWVRGMQGPNANP